jgi:hypothetical protein
MVGTWGICSENYMRISLWLIMVHEPNSVVLSIRKVWELNIGEDTETFSWLFTNHRQIQDSALMVHIRFLRHPD